MTAPAVRSWAGPSESCRWIRVRRGSWWTAHTAVFSIPAGGGTPRLLAVFQDPNISAVRGGWGFADGRMYYSAEERQSDVWVMEVERP